MSRTSESKRKSVNQQNLTLNYDSEEGGDTCLRYFRLSPNYTALQLRSMQSPVPLLVLFGGPACCKDIEQLTMRNRSSVTCYRRGEICLISS
jgi:hypothetical protein